MTIVYYLFFFCTTEHIKLAVLTKINIECLLRYQKRLNFVLCTTNSRQSLYNAR